MTADDDTTTVSTQIGQFAWVPVWVLNLDLKGAELAVYVALRSYANADRDARPSVKKIADRAGVHKSTAESAITKFRRMGLIETTRRYRTDGSISGCDYHLFDLMPEALRDTKRGGASPQTGTPPPTGTPPATDGGVPRPRREQEQTNEQTSSSESSPPENSRAKVDLPRPDVEALCALLADLIEGNGVKRPQITKDWRTECRRLLDIDKPKGGPDGVERVMRWAMADSFWRANVLSMPKFRKQYPQLVLKARAEWERRHRSSDIPTTTQRVMDLEALREHPRVGAQFEIGGVG